MLLRLTVENYALIDRLEMELEPGLNIITGETGAGKSILLGALGLLSGNKNDGTAIKDRTRNCVVEGVFDLSATGLEPFFEANDLDFAPETSVRRMITPAGKSRAFVNDVPVQLTLLRELGARLLDIHSQHQNLILASEEFRISALDTLAGNEELLRTYGAAYARMSEARRRLAELQEQAAAGRRDEEWLRFQCDELAAAALRPGEQAELEAEQAVLSNADRIGEAMIALRNDLDADETGILHRIGAHENALLHLRDSYPDAAAYAERLRAVLLELKDIDASVTAASERIEADPERLQALDARLGVLYALCSKHRTETVDELIAVRDRYAAQLAAIDRSDEAIAATEQELRTLAAETGRLAAQLHAARAKAAPAFERRIDASLARLGMPDACFRIGLDAADTPNRTGADRVSYLFSANRNVAPQPVERIASGGELSRVMLALKSLLAERMQLPTIVFDEIDTGVSGRIADAMGEIIATLSGSMQVIDITHLPQVASKGETHFVVGRTEIARLTEAERMTEIAKMLSGSEITDAALAQARILLGK